MERLNKDEINMTDELKDIFDNVNNWLKFAEAKNATMTAGNGLVIFGVSKLILMKDLNINEYLLYYIYFSLFMMTLSFVVALISFMPNVKLPSYIFNNNEKKANNLLFFGSIMEYNEDNYLRDLKDTLGLENDNYKKNKINQMYANQIIINSKIAMKKYKLFNMSLHFTLVAILSPILYLFFRLFND